mmetsp:Transcript_16079/g.51478  ORF Transcript_16079/g.51478 Transcript_16079/m.51478 type:complete len:98 (-) Transcript_16079:117-410(-)
MAEKGVSIEGKTFTAKQIKDGKVEISEGTFIVGVIKDKKAQVLSAAKADLDWAPETPFSDAMPMFWGKMGQDKILYFLGKDDVEFIEADGVVTICEK